MSEVLTKKKKIFFYLLTVGLIIFIPIVCYFGFFAFRKLTLSYNYCGAYGELDEELGWKLKENASSCVSLKNFLTGETYFDNPIYTNNLGFRDIETNRGFSKGAITAIGSSFTFGYGLNYEETFSYLLSQKINFPVLNMGVPMYGSGSILLLFERYVKKIRPSVVIYYSGVWERSLCFSKIKPSENLVPCFWWDDQKKQIELIKPRPGKVFEEAKKYSYPHGALSAGYNNLEYFLIIKPIMIMNDFKIKALNKIKSTLGLREINLKNPKMDFEYTYDGQSYSFNITGAIERKRLELRKRLHLADQSFPLPSKKYLPEPGHGVVFAQIDSVFEYTLRRYAKLAEEHGFTFLILDEINAYKPYLEDIKRDFGISMIHIGASEWKNSVADPISKLPEELTSIPKDGHPTIVTNRLIAKLITDTLIKNSILPTTK